MAGRAAAVLGIMVLEGRTMVVLFVRLQRQKADQFCII